MRFRPAILLRYAAHCGIIMHTYLLPGGQWSLFKAILIQIKQTHKSPGQNQINSSSFCASVSIRFSIEWLHLHIFLNWNLGWSSHHTSRYVGAKQQ